MSRMTRGLLAVSVALLAVRLYAATQVGFGDSEALYASWALHPQPAYLDHPGLVGMVARAIGEGGVPSPTRVHVVTSIMATLVPWIVYVVARASRAAERHAATAALVVALAPVTAVGLFALTPDALLAPLWFGALGLAAVGLGGTGADDGEDHGETVDARRAACLVGAGLLAGVAASSKAPGLLLVASLLVTYAWTALASAPSARDVRARAAARTLWPYAGVLAGLVVLAPVVAYEARMGFPMLRHRLVDTQAGAGVSLRNVGAVVGGQLLYVSPVLAWIAFVVARDLVRSRTEDPTSRLLFVAFAVPLVPLLAVCLWSRVAEPHWLAPAWLALVVHGARRGGALLSRRLLASGVAVAAVLVVGAHVWVLVPATGRLAAPPGADPRLDLASELYGWPEVFSAARDQMRLAAAPFDPEGREVVVVGPHWTVCAQLHAGLPDIRVGCATEVRDDFDRWLPRAVWRRAEHVLFVTDNRFPEEGSAELPAHVPVARRQLEISRGGRVARTFTLTLFARRSAALRSP